MQGSNDPADALDNTNLRTDRRLRGGTKADRADPDIGRRMALDQLFNPDTAKMVAARPQQVQASLIESAERQLVFRLLQCTLPNVFVTS